MEDRLEFSARHRVADSEWSGLLLGWFETLSVLAVLVAGVAFTVVGWDEFVGSGRAWVVVLLVVGGSAAVAVAL